METLLTVIVVNYNTVDLLSKCLTSIEENTTCPCYEVIVIDNASSDDSCKAAQASFPSVRFIVNRENRGFAAAVNQGIIASRSRYMMFLNPDTLVTPHALDKMLTFMEQRVDAAVLGCKLLNFDGSLQPSCSNSFLSIGYVFWRLLVRMLFLEQWLDKIAPNVTYPGRLTLTPAHHEQVQQVEHIVGAAFMVRRDTVNKVGLLDEGYFLYLEETDWFYRVRQSQLAIYYLPDAIIFHLEGGSSKPSGNLYFNERVVHIYRGKLRFFQKHHSHWEYKTYQCLLIFIIGLKLSLAAVAWLVGFRRDEMHNRLRGYRRILREVFKPASTKASRA